MPCSYGLQLHENAYSLWCPSVSTNSKINFIYTKKTKLLLQYEVGSTMRNPGCYLCTLLARMKARCSSVEFKKIQKMRSISNTNNLHDKIFNILNENYVIFISTHLTLISGLS